MVLFMAAAQWARQEHKAASLAPGRPAAEMRLPTVIEF